MFGGRDPFDPFDMFAGMNRQMRQMDQMMDQMFMDPFEMLGVRPRVRPEATIEDGSTRRRSRDRREVAMQDMGDPVDMMSPFGFRGGLFGGLLSQMNNLQEHAMNDPNSHVYTQSTFISYDGSDNGPHVVQSSTRKAGDATESRRSVRRGNEVDEMSVGHRIGNRSHTIEKKRDSDGRLRSQHTFQNVDDEEAEQFDREFHTRVRRNFGLEPDYLAIGDNGSRRQRRTGRDRNQERTSYDSHSSNGPIITIPDDDDEPAPSSNQRERSSNGNKGPIIREVE